MERRPPQNGKCPHISQKEVLLFLVYFDMTRFYGLYLLGEGFFIFIRKLFLAQNFLKTFFARVFEFQCLHMHIRGKWNRSTYAWIDD